MSIYADLNEERKRIMEIASEDIEEPTCPLGHPKCDGFGNLIDRDYSYGFCECKKARIKDVRWERYLESISKTSDPEAARPEVVSEETGVVKAVLRSWTSHKDCKAVFIYGAPGIGKTQTAHYLAKRIITKHGLEGRFIDCRQLSEAVAVQLEDLASQDYLQRARMSVYDKASVVVLDDIGAETRESATKFISGLLERRFVQESWTIVTSNRRPTELKQVYGDILIQRMFAGPRWMFEHHATGSDLRQALNRPEMTQKGLYS